MILNQFICILLFSSVLLCNCQFSDMEDPMDPFLKNPLGDMDPYSDYGDPYSTYGMNPYGNQKSSEPPIKELTDLDQIQSFIDEDISIPAVIGYFDVLTNEEDLEAFKEIAYEEGKSYRFAFTISDDVIQSKKFKGSVIYVHPAKKYLDPKLDKPKFRFPSNKISNLGSVKEFIHKKSLPLVGELNYQTLALYENFNQPQITAFGYVDSERNPKAFKYISNRMKKVATKYKGQFSFNIANKVDFMQSMNTKYEIDTSNDKPDTIYIGLKDGNMYYKSESNEKFSSESLENFIQDFLNGKLVGVETEVKEEPSGSESLYGEAGSKVQVVSTSNFDATVRQNTNADILLEFYAPWCGHCQALKPEYERVAQYFEEDEKTLIMAMDADANQVPEGFDIQGYPTLIFIPADKSKPSLPYEGPRDSESMISFINAHK